ncbi:MAG: hypothetical protein QF459_01750, partial [Candidatus Poseidoniia archaeon]|nr:hypothetical protein [Candidatus Poseidoniia archaeon]
LEPGETATLVWYDSQLRYERIMHVPEEPDIAIVFLEVGIPLPDIPEQPLPFPSPLVVLAALGLAARRNNRHPF